MFLAAESTTLLSIAAIVISVIGLLVSVFNYKRDKYRVVVELDWDNGRHYVGMRANVVETWGAITVSNQGRRPVYIRTVGIKYPDNEKVFNLLPEGSSDGVKLGEGDSPIVLRVIQDERLQRYAARWKELYAVAYDVAGKEYKSGRSWSTPSWAGQQHIQ